jgi:broad specificity phosphatase PhoE
MSSLILLRHGQAAFGADRYDALSERGREQAEHLATHLATRGARFDRLWVGPRDRHRLTAKHALEPLGLDWQIPADPALDEFAEGQQILGAVQAQIGRKPTGQEAARHYMDEIDAWARGTRGIEGVPTPARFRATVRQWAARATADSTSGQRVLAVTSGGVIAAVLADALGLPDAALAHFMHVIYNGSLTEFAFSAGRAPALVSFNVASYLPDALLTRV